MSAVISECQQYRYRLARQVAPLFVTLPILFIGVNPSTADADQDDATIRKMTGFTQRWGYSSFMVGNVFAHRATDVHELADAADPVGKHNQHHLEQMLSDCAFVVPCWGNVTKVPKSLRQWFMITRIAVRLSQRPVKVFGFTSSGDPMHPLMLSYDTPLREWDEL